MRGIRILCRAALSGSGAISLMGCTMFGGGRGGREEVDFVTDVKPIFEHRCLACHGRKSPEGGLSFQDREVVMKTYRGGTRLVDPGYPERSLLYLAAARPGVHPDMMPRDGWKLTDGQLVTLRKWIGEGAEWPKGKKGELEVKEMIVEMEDYP